MTAPYIAVALRSRCAADSPPPPRRVRLENPMKSLLLSAALACAALANLAHAAPVQLVQAPPDTQVAYGTQADTGTGPLDVQLQVGAALPLLSLTWWGYHLPGSAGTEQFEVHLNGNLVGSQSQPLGQFSSQATGDQLADPAGGPDVAALIRYELVFAPGVQSLAGTNLLSIGNEDSGAEWFWQGTGAGTDPYRAALTLVGDRTNPVPEPASLAVVLAALAAAGATGVRRRA